MNLTDLNAIAQQNRLFQHACVSGADLPSMSIFTREQAMKFVDTSVLRIGYEEWNPDAARTVVLLHGWPDSPRTWAQVAPELALQGWRVIVPALRGFSPTRFLSDDTPRSGQLSVLGRDLLELIAQLRLHKPALVGHDWGARAAGNACALQPGVASHLVLLSVAYGTNLPSQDLSLDQARQYWYHWYMATPRGQRAVRENRNAFAKIMWETWAPSGWFTPEEFETTAQAFANDDWLEVTLHSYQHRWGHAPGDARYAAEEQALSIITPLDVPTLILHGDADGVNLPASFMGQSQYFLNRYERKLMPGIGHFPQREDPEQIASELIKFLAV
jgi:pimeloyl-ACP methyl ester carboxylesterase